METSYLDIDENIQSSRIASKNKLLKLNWWHSTHQFQHVEAILTQSNRIEPEKSQNSNKLENNNTVSTILPPNSLPIFSGTQGVMGEEKNEPVLEAGVDECDVKDSHRLVEGTYIIL